MKRGDVCVADREHQRIVCFNLTGALEQRADGQKEQTLSWLPLVIHRPGVCRIFGVTSHGLYSNRLSLLTILFSPPFFFSLTLSSSFYLAPFSPPARELDLIKSSKRTRTWVTYYSAGCNCTFSDKSLFPSFFFFNSTAYVYAEGTTRCAKLFMREISAAACRYSVVYGRFYRRISSF